MNALVAHSLIVKQRELNITPNNKLFKCTLHRNKIRFIIQILVVFFQFYTLKTLMTLPVSI
jgi:hypothetical protein